VIVGQRMTQTAHPSPKEIEFVVGHCPQTRTQSLEVNRDTECAARALEPTGFCSSHFSPYATLSTMPKPRAPKLTLAQVEIVAQFADFAFDYPGLSFDAVARKVLPKGFGTGPRAKRLRQEAKEVFERERDD